MTAQSGIISDDVVGTTTKQNMTEFVDQNESFTTSIHHTMDSTRYTTANSEDHIKNFFERPIIIQEYNWNPNEPITTAGPNDQLLFAPWERWLANKRVANRVNNYRNMKGIMHVKFLVNGNAFYWGKAFASFVPKSSLNTTFEAGRIMSIMPALQRPHIWLDPSTSQGGELVLPFFHKNDNFDLTGLENPADLGLIWIETLVNLQHTQSVSTGMRLTVYAWVEGIELSSPTHVNKDGLAPQSGDEFGTGPISKPASIVSKMAGVLSAVPSIAPLALATQKAAGTLANVASHFGYSRPRVIVAERPMKIWQTGDLASTDQEDTSSTLALTCKQEVTLDPRVAGLGDVDELAFSHLNKIPAYFTKAPWLISDPAYYPIISMSVTPAMFAIGSHLVPPSQLGYALTPTAFTGLPFRYWKGEMTYRFQLAASGYHKGRLLVVWDPVAAQSVPELNTVYSKVIDIAEERDFSITVGWGNPRPALDIPNTISGGLLEPFTKGGLHTDLKANGILTVYVLNKLVSSGDNPSPVQLLCHSYSTDMTYWSPNSEHINKTTYQPQSGLVPQSGEESDANSPTITDAPVQDESVGKFGGFQTPQVAMYLAGESIDSFRTCLKRYCLVRSIQFAVALLPLRIVEGSATFNSYIPFRRLDWPWPQTVHAYVAGAYSGVRGATRHKILPRLRDPVLGVETSAARVARSPDIDWSDSMIVGTSEPYGLTGLQKLTNKLDDSWSGAQQTNPVSGGVLQVEIPWQTFQRYEYVPPQNLGSANQGGKMTVLAINTDTDSTVNGSEVWDQYFSVGEDYNLFFFMGVQPMWDLPDSVLFPPPP